MNLVTPDLGLLFWQSLIFFTVLFILAKFAWKPIVKALEERENVIADALSAAEKAKEEMKNLQASNEKMLQEARLEREKMMKDAQVTANNIIAEAKEKATEEADRIVYNAKALIETEKNAALAEVKNTAANLSLQIAEKLLKKNLSGDDSQKALVNEYIKEAKLN
ncbi:MAG TPA: F0F1 ATP synthase subunit B [Cytophagaceae bacterium]|jgi:F-type H+-transporting ATPase subunit b|nr:F0F1 ATP synthase subunit B [Cytophagaceae bacterium]